MRLFPSRKNERISSIELLRILSMLMIVSYHFACHSSISYPTEYVSFPRLWYNLLCMGGKIGVNVFVLISGYFLINNTTTHISPIRVIKLWGQIAFYSILINLFGVFVGEVDFGIRDFVDCFFPIIKSTWWFASTYFVLYLLHPFINHLLASFEKHTYQAFLMLIFLLWCIIPTIFHSDFQSNDLLWFLFLYCVAGYIRVYGLNSRFHHKHYVIMWIVFLVLTYCSSLFFTFLGAHNPRFALYFNYFYRQNSLTIFMVSICMFMSFLTLNIPNTSIINTIASTTFGVYLIHDHEIMRSFIWLRLFQGDFYQYSNLLVIYSIAAVLCVYVACSIMDFIRQLIFEYPFMLLINRYISYCISSIRCIYKKTIEFLFQ